MTASLLTVQILQAFTLSLMIVGFFLIGIELRTRFDRSFLFYGLALVLLSWFAAFDLWKILDAKWLRLQHVVFCLFPPVMLRYLSFLTERDTTRLMRTTLAAATATSVLLLLTPSFVDTKSQGVPTAWYYAVFLPYFLYCVSILTWFLVREVRSVRGKRRSILLAHFYGLLFLLLAGTLDLLQFVKGIVFLPAFPSFTIAGVIALGTLLAYLFTERLILLIRERLMYIDRLQEAYKDLEGARSLSEIGRSSAIINHEIKNFTCIISGYGQYLLERAGLKAPFDDMARRIIETATRLTNFSDEILDFSKSKILRDKKPLAIGPLIQRCVEHHFGAQAERFSFSGLEPELTIHGDWRKLEHVFVNLLKNALEAGAQEIRIKFLPRDFVLLVCIEDDGQGIEAEELPHLFEAFHTTKDSGTGLGLPTSRSIIETHGGHISAVSKNLLGKNNHGLTFNIVFPTYATDRRDAKDSILFIKDKLENLAEIIRVFQNVFVNPYVLDSIDDVKELGLQGERLRVVASPQVIAGIVGTDSRYQCYSLVCGSDGVVRVVGSPPDRYEGIFSEEFVLERLLADKTTKMIPVVPPMHEMTPQ